MVFVSNESQGSSLLTPIRIHCTTILFVPSKTGQPEWVVKPSSDFIVFGFKYEKKAAAPTFGFTKTLACWKLVAPPSSGTSQYITMVATRPPFLCGSPLHSPSPDKYDLWLEWRMGNAFLNFTTYSEAYIGRESDHPLRCQSTEWT